MIVKSAVDENGDDKRISSVQKFVKGERGSSLMSLIYRIKRS